MSAADMAPHSAGGMGAAEEGEFDELRPVSSGMEHGEAQGLSTAELEGLKEDAKYGVAGPPPAVEAFASPPGTGGEGVLSPDAVAEEERAADRLWDELQYMWRAEEEAEAQAYMQASTSDGEGGGEGGAPGGARVSRAAHTRVVSTLRTSHEKAAAADRMAAKVSIADTRAELGRWQDRRAQCEEELLRAEDILAGLEAEGAHLASETERVAALVPARPDTVKKIERRRAECRAAYVRQRMAVEAARAALGMAEHELRGVEIAAVNLQATSEEVDLAEEQGRARQEERAIALRRAEERAGERIRARQREAKDAYKEEMALAEDRRLKQVAAAREGRRAAVERLRAQLEEVRRTEERQGEAGEAELVRRTNVIVQLKQSMEAAFAELQKRNAVRAQRTAKKQRAQNREFAQLLASGKNPYEVFRKRDEDARVARRRRERANETERRQMAIVKQMLREDDEHKAKVARQREAAEFRREFDAEMGLEAREARVQKYMEETTMDGRDVLDPTGRLPVHPSAATRQKTWKFGLGKGTDPEVVQMLQAKHNTTPQPLLLPRMKTPPVLPVGATSDTPVSIELAGTPSQGEEGAGEGAGGAAAAGGKDATVAGEPAEAPPAPPDDDDDEGPVGGGAWGEEEEAPKLWEPKLSKLEKERMANIRDKQRENLVQPQVVCRREFKGDAFLPTPKVLLFRDFEVGKTYDAQVVLTNVSFSFNSFRLLDIEDAYRDFFTIEYIFPGRMSAGTTCTLNVTFAPMVSADIDTVIPLVAETGYINIPLQCRTKKCIIDVAPHHMRFAAVLAETHVQRLRFTNSGAIPTDFELIAAGPPTGPAPSPPHMEAPPRLTS